MLGIVRQTLFGGPVCKIAKSTFVNAPGDVSVFQSMASTHVFNPVEHISEEPEAMEMSAEPLWTKQPRSPWWKCSHARCNARPWSTKALFCRAVLRPLCALVFFLGLLKILALTWHGLVFLFPVLDAHLEPWFLPHETSVFPYWSTHGVIPVPCHSHNDYWRRVPLQSALAAGCISVEADVWLSGDELLVGHTQHSLTSEQTLRKLYLEPLRRMLYKYNAMAENVTLSTNNDDLAGVFATDPAQTLLLLVDFKDNGEKTWSHLVKQLEPLRQDGFLSHVNGSDLIRRPITVVVTGNASFNQVLENTPRDVFYDAPLDELSTALDSPPVQSSVASRSKAVPGVPYTPLNSYYASADFRETIGSVALHRFSQGQLVRLRRQLKAAHDLGLKVRYWGTPNWPRGVRNHVWQVLVREGVDVISTDDLRDATSQDWEKHRGWWG